MKVAIVILAGLDSHDAIARVVNALEAANECKQAGDTVKMLFDGAGTEALAKISDPKHQLYPLFEPVADTVHGACSFCARAFGVWTTVKERAIPLLDEYHEHPSLRKLLYEKYQVLTF